MPAHVDPQGAERTAAADAHAGRDAEVSDPGDEDVAGDDLVGADDAERVGVALIADAGRLGVAVPSAWTRVACVGPGVAIGVQIVVPSRARVEAVADAVCVAVVVGVQRTRIAVVADAVAVGVDRGAGVAPRLAAVAVPAGLAHAGAVARARAMQIAGQQWAAGAQYVARSVGRLACVHERAVETRDLASTLTGPGAADGRGGGRMLLVGGAVTVVVDAVTGGVGVARWRPRGAAVEHRSVDALGDACSGAEALATAGDSLGELLVGGAVAVVVHAVAAGVSRAQRGARSAAVRKGAIDAQRAADGPADAGPAGRDPAEEVLVGDAVAVVVHAVAAGVERRAVASLAPVDDRAQHTGGGAGRGACARAALRGLAGEVLVGRSVAVVVHAIAGGVHVRAGRRRAVIHQRATDARRCARGAAGPQAAGGGGRHEVLVGGAVAVVVHAVADDVEAARVGQRLAGVDDRSVDAG